MKMKFIKIINVNVVDILIQEQIDGKLENANFATKEIIQLYFNYLVITPVFGIIVNYQKF